MSEQGGVELVWAGDERRFRLPIAQLLALQERRDCGPLEIINRLSTGTWRVEDVQEVLRLGLIGAGVDNKVARRLVEDNVVEGHLMDAAEVAFQVLWPALKAPEPVGKEMAATGLTPEAAASPPLPSTETAQ